MHLSERASIVLGTFLLLATLSPLSASAITPPAGCRAETPADRAARQAKGLTVGTPVCAADEQILGIGQGFDQFYAQLRAASPCNRNTCTLSCRTRNTGAQVCGPTSRRWNSIGCHSNNNTAIFPTVAHGYAAHIELLRRYCGERGRCTIGQVVQQWTATAGDRSSYANFVSRHSGVPINQVFDPNDINVMGRLALSMACFEAGSLPYSLEDLKSGLSMAAGGPRVPVPDNVGALLNESLTGSYSSNWTGSPNSNPGSWNYPPSSLGGNNTYFPPPPPPQPLPVIPSQPLPGLQPTNFFPPASTVPTLSGATTSSSTPSSDDPTDKPSIAERLMRIVYGTDDGSETKKEQPTTNPLYSDKTDAINLETKNKELSDKMAGIEPGTRDFSYPAPQTFSSADLSSSPSGLMQSSTNLFAILELLRRMLVSLLGVLNPFGTYNVP